MITCSALCLSSPFGMANPEDGTVVSGTVGMEQSGKTLTIRQGTDKASINWKAFNIDADETVHFIQPSQSSIILNRVRGNTPSNILGILQANGNVLLINPNGIMFGKDSKIDVGKIVASTADITDQDFLNSNRSFNFSLPGHPDAKIINLGSITAREAGLVGLVAPQVENQGIISARLGRVQLGAGNTATIDLYGDDLMNIEVNDIELKSISQTGMIQADGGVIQITAAAGKDVVNSLIGVSGYLSAQSVGTKNGRIVIYAEGSNAVQNNVSTNKGKNSGKSLVMTDAAINASGHDAGEKGGQVDILADDVKLAAGTLIDASGDQGGGQVHVGGDYLGSGATPASLTTTVDADAYILNNAVTKGDGGKTIVWSDGDTDFQGNIFARGGAEGGNGGFAETSGHHNLNAQGYVDLTAPKGEKGTYLLDPANIAIYGNVDPAFVSTDASINLAAILRFWVDASDAATVTLNFNDDALSTARVTGVAGSNTIVTTSNLNLTAPLAVGAKIRLGNTNGQTALASDTTNANTYIIQSISYTAGVGTTITLSSNLSTSYNTGVGNNFLYRGLVSQWNDKSGNNYHVTEATASRAPLWISTAQNGRGGIRFDGGDNMISAAGAYPINANYTVGVQVNQTAANTGNVLSGIGSGHAFYFNGSQRICMFSGGCFVTSSNNLPYGTPGIIGGSFVNSTRLGTVYQNGVNVGSGTGSASNTQNTFNLGSYGNANYYTGFINEAYLYNSVLTTPQRNLVDQYQSAKWNIALDPNSGTALSEAAESMDATTGYSVFTTRYLERLSQTANLSLQASNNITLDLKNDTLNLATAGRSLTLTAGNQINTQSAGTITTNGGNITFNATGGINLAHSLGLNTNGGHITMANDLTLGANQTFSAGTGNLTFIGTVNGGNNLAATGNAFTLLNNWGGITSLGLVSLTSLSSLTLPSISASSILTRTTGAGSDIIIGSGATLSASGTGDALVVASGRNFINNSGVSALSAPSGRWLVYSTRPADNQRNGVMPNAEAIYNATYTGTPPAGVASGNRFLFNSLLSAAPAQTFTADNQSKQYGAVNPTLTYTRSGSFVDADTAADAFNGTPDITTAVDGTTGVSTVTGGIDAAAGSLVSYLGYRFVFFDGDFVITPAPLTITANDRTKNYGDSVMFVGTEFTQSGLINSDSITSVTLNSTGALMAAGVLGSPYAIAASAAAGTGLGNYTITYADGSLTVNPVALSITADDKSRNYGDTNPAFTATYMGLVAGDTAADISGLNLTTPAGPVSPPGTYTIQASGAASSNYTISMYNGVLTVGGSIPTPGTDDPVSSDVEALEPIYHLVDTLSEPIAFTDDGTLPVADISYDDDLKNYLTCAYHSRDKKTDTSCW